MRTYRVKRDSWTVLAGILNANEPFTTSGSMRGETDPVLSKGNMPTNEYDLLKLRHDTEPISYAVWSYGTIIGYKWRGRWFVPDCTYSLTTTIQQNKLRVAVS